jgi:lipoprotein-anchoring transpeptidase ErfK/SrfK
VRAKISLVVIAVVLAGGVGSAAAQYGYPPPPSGYPAPTYSQAPLPPPGGDGSMTEPPGGAYGRPPTYRDVNGAPIDPRSVASEPSVGGPYEPYPPPRRAYADPYGETTTAPQPLPSVGGEPIARPPADVGDAANDPNMDVTGTVRAPAGAIPQAPGRDANAMIAALPPEDQPETGPRKELPPQFRRQLVDYVTKEPAGTLIIDTPHTYLYLVMGNGRALRYGIGVGREGFTWSGSERISRMKEWPDWFPPKEMIDRQPYLPRFMAGGDTNPLGARALYLGNTLYRIHGTNQPSTIGTFVSSGCIRLTNDDISDLYTRVSVGTRVVVLPGAMQPLSAAGQAAGQGSVTQ